MSWRILLSLGMIAKEAALTALLGLPAEALPGWLL